MIDVMVAGRLNGQPTVRMAFSGKPLSSTFKVEAMDNSGQRLFFSCVAYSEMVIHEVLGMSDGDSIAVTGDVDLANLRGCDRVTRRWLHMSVLRVLRGHHTHTGSELLAGGAA